MLKLMKRELYVQETSSWTLFGRQIVISRERLIQSSAILFFLPFELSTAIMAIVLIAAALNRSLYRAIRLQSGSFFLYGFVLLQMTASLLAGNAMGLLNSLGTLVVVLFAQLVCASLNERSLATLLKSVGLLSIAASLAGFLEFGDLVEHSGMDLLYCLQTLPDNTRIQLTYHNPNLFATMAVFYVCINAYLLVKSTKVSERLLWSSAIVLSVCALILTGCRAALIPLPFILPLYLYYLKKKRWLQASLGVEACGVGVLLFHPYLIPRFGKMESIDARMSIWEGSLEGITLHPMIGGGPQYYQMVSEKFGTMPAPHAHNLLLDLLLNSGLLGMAAIVTYAIGAVSRMMSAQLTRKNPAYAAMVLSMIASILIEGLVDCTINFPAPALLLLVCLNAPAVLEQRELEIHRFILPFEPMAVPFFELPARSHLSLSYARSPQAHLAMHSPASIRAVTRTRDAPS